MKSLALTFSLALGPSYPGMGRWLQQALPAVVWCSDSKSHWSWTGPLTKRNEMTFCSLLGYPKYTSL